MAPQEEKVAEKTEFNVKLEKFDAAAKAKLIREIKNIIPGINLVEVMDFVRMSRTTRCSSMDSLSGRCF